MDQPQQQGGLRSAQPVNPLGPPAQPPADQGNTGGVLDTLSEMAGDAWDSLTSWWNGGDQQPVNQTPGQQPAQQQTTATPPVTTNVAIQQSVGAGGANMPADVLQVQNRLVTLGYLSAANFQAEQANPATPTAIADTALRQTIVAISKYFQATFGRPGMLLQPNQASSTFLNNQPAQALGSVTITGNVGRGATNNAADVRVVQQRLAAIGFLSADNLTAEAVAATATGVVADASLAQTIAAIRSFNTQIAGSSLHIIRVGGRELDLLNNPPAFRAGTVSITNSVGTGQQNNPADVTAVQTRLVALGFLTAAQQTAEAPAAGATARVADAALAQTIASLTQFQTAMGLTANGQVVPGSDTHRQLLNPALHEKSSITLNASVGDAGGNRPADVRLVQDRLQSIGLLSTGDYMSERVDSTLTTPVNVTTIPLTMAALDNFLRTAVGVTTRLINPGSRELRLLNDPSYGTNTNVNLEANNAAAGFNFVSADAALNRIIAGIETVEAGRFTGEIGAVLTNGAGTAASFGKGQVIGTTALDTLSRANNADLRNHYGLTQNMLTEMTDRSTRTNERYDAIYALVPAGGSAPGALQTAITNYTTTNGQAFVQQTGLGTDDIARMFHTANMRRRILAVNVPRDADSTLFQGTNAQLEAHVTTLMGDNNFTNSTNFLGITRDSVKTYFKRTAFMGENRAAFRTKAIFNHPEGQRVRNAMTDNNGTAIGRIFLRDQYNATTPVVPNTDPNRARNIAAIVAIMHNSGGTPAGRYAQMNTVLANPYVQSFLAVW